MSIWEVLFTGVGLAADAFGVSLCKGVSSKQSYLKTGLLCGLWFGIFQGLMPLLGWLLGSTVASYISAYTPYLSFIILAYLGVKMIIDSVKELREGQNCGCESVSQETGSCNLESKDTSLAPMIMLTMAISTSIDALAVGFATLQGVNIYLAVSLIAAVTFVCCFIGSIIGAKLGSKFKTPAEIGGGAILVVMGLKFLIEGLIQLL